MNFLFLSDFQKAWEYFMIYENDDEGFRNKSGDHG